MISQVIRISDFRKRVLSGSNIDSSIQTRIEVELSLSRSAKRQEKYPQRTSPPVDLFSEFNIRQWVSYLADVYLSPDTNSQKTPAITI
jgi:hypothetical protein